MSRGYRKIGFASKERKAAFRKLATDLLYYESIETTVDRAKELRKIVEPLITLAKKNCDDFQTVIVKTKVARKDKNGKRIHEDKDGKRVVVFDEIEKTIKKDNPKRLNARRKMLRVFYKITVLPKGAKKKKAVEFDLAKKMFDEIGPRYKERNGGYTRIIKIGKRKGDNAEMAVIQLV